jgi:hypothetical protein
VGVSGICQSRSVVSGVGAGNDNDEDVQGVGLSEQLKSGEGSKEPRQGSVRRVGKAGGRRVKSTPWTAGKMKSFVEGGKAGLERGDGRMVW